MKKIIRLTESDIRNMVKRVLREFDHDEWGERDRGYYPEYLELNIANLIMNEIPTEYDEEYDQFILYADKNKDAFTVTGKYVSPYADSFNMREEMFTIEGADKVRQAIMAMPIQNDAFKQDVMDIADEIINSLTKEDFEYYLQQGT